MRWGVLRRRDKGCRFPGCTHDKYVDAHHIRHWADGGETSLDNLAMLCRRHHRLIHEGGFSLRSVAGQLEFHSPKGELINASCDNAAEKRYRGNVYWLYSENMDLGVEPESLLPEWRGEGLDLEWVVSLLPGLEPNSRDWK